MITFSTLIVIGFALLCLGSAVAVVTVKNPVKAALCLVLCLVSCAPIWLFLQAEFLAITLILVYVGAVMVLFLFVIMMLDINQQLVAEKFTAYFPLALFVALVLVGEIVVLVMFGGFEQNLEIFVTGSETFGSNTRQLGYVLYTEHLFSFELAALILLVAMIIALVLTIGNEQQAKTQYLDASQQVKVSAKDRLQIIKMPSEKKRGLENDD